MIPTDLGRHDALLIVDVQKDFFPGGALPVTDCERVIDALNRWIDAATRAGCLIIATRDWHPADHLSFQSQGGPWPPHCLQQTAGAEFCDGLQLPGNAAIISKGTDPKSEQYSPFERQELRDLLRERGIRRLWIGGVAQEFCVRGAVLDAIGAGFAVHVILEATAPVRKDDARRALDEMQAAGAIFE
jgi:nicotinamidase/pyrazinamidase